MNNLKTKKNHNLKKKQDNINKTKINKIKYC